MLPVLFKFDPGASLLTTWICYLLGVAITAYTAIAGWEGAAGALNPKTGKPGKATTQDRATRALSYGVPVAGICLVALYYVLPSSRLFGGRGEGVPFHTYGFMMAGGFAGAVWLATKLAEREWPGEEAKRREQIFDLAFWVFIAGLGGAMLLFRIVNWKETPGLDEIQRNPSLLIDCVTRGLVFYGGLIGAALASMVFARMNRIQFLRLADLAIPTVSFGQAMGRLGCFSAGCCWGRPVEKGFLFGVHFPGAQVVKNLFGGQGPASSLAYQSQAGDHRWVVESTGQVFEQFVPGSVRISQWVAEHGTTLPIHPTQLYESIGQLCIFVGLLAMRRYRRFHGQILGLWLMAYAVLRYTVELFRGDLERGTLRGLFDSLDFAGLAARVPLSAWYNISISEFISLCMFALGATILVRQGRRLYSGSLEGGLVAG